MILMIDDNGAILSAKLNDVTIFNPNIEIEKDTHKIELEIDTFENLFDNYVSDNVLAKIGNKDEFYKPYKKEKTTLEKYVKEVLNNMVLSSLPEGETLTKENAPSLVDIIKPENKDDKPEEGKLGDINNTIEVVGNVSTDGFLYTYGLYYTYSGKKYKCERGGAPDTQGSVKLYYTPDQLIGHYFVSV